MYKLAARPVRTVAGLVELNTFLGFVVRGDMRLLSDFLAAMSKGTLVSEFTVTFLVPIFANLI